MASSMVILNTNANGNENSSLTSKKSPIMSSSSTTSTTTTATNNLDNQNDNLQIKIQKQTSNSSKNGSRISSAASLSSHSNQSYSILGPPTPTNLQSTPQATHITHNQQLNTITKQQHQQQQHQQQQQINPSNSIVTIISKNNNNNNGNSLYDLNNNNTNKNNSNSHRQETPSSSRYSSSDSEQLDSSNNNNNNNNTNQKLYVSTQSVRITNNNNSSSDLNKTYPIDQQQQQHSNPSSAKIKIKYNYENFPIPNFNFNNLNHFESNNTNSLNSSANSNNQKTNDIKQESTDSLSSSLSTLSSPSSSPTNRSPPSSNSPLLSTSIGLNYPLSNAAIENKNILDAISEYPLRKSDHSVNNNNNIKNTHSNTHTPSSYDDYELINRNIKSPQMHHSNHHRQTPTQTNGSNSTIKTKKKVSFNDSLVQVHLIPNMSSFFNVEKYRYQQLKPTNHTAEIIKLNENFYNTSSFIVDSNNSSSISNNNNNNNNSTNANVVSSNNHNSSINNSGFMSPTPSSHSSLSNYNDYYMPSDDSTLTNSSNYQTINPNNIINNNNNNHHESFISKSNNFPKSSKHQLRHIDSDQHIVSDLKKNIRHHHSHFNSNSSNSNGQLQVVKLTLHNAKFNTNNEQPILSNNTQNFLTIIGNNHLVKQNGQSSRRESSSNPNQSRSVHSQIFTSQRSSSSIPIKESNNSSETQNQTHSQTQTHDEPKSPNSSNTSNSTITNNNINTSPVFAFPPKPPKLLPSNSRVSGSASYKSHRHTHENSTKKDIHKETALLVEETSAQLKHLANMKKSKPSNVISSNDIIENLTRQNYTRDHILINQPGTPSTQSKVTPSPRIETNISNIENTRPHSPSLSSLSKNSMQSNTNIPRNPTKFVFLKQDENLIREPSFTTKSHTISNINLIANSNPIGSSLSQASFTTINTDNTNNSSKNGNDLKNITNNSPKTVNLSSVNQLIALKDVNYYLANSSRSNSKAGKHQTITNQNYQNYPISYSQASNYSNSVPNGVVNEVHKIKIKTNGQINNPNNLIESDFRRTHSALPLLRNNLKTNLSNTNSVNNGLNNVNYSINNNNNNNSIDQNQLNIKSNQLPINGVNTLSYKLVNSPLLNTLTRAKTFLYSQNHPTTTNSIEKRIRGGSIDKTSF